MRGGSVLGNEGRDGTIGRVQTDLQQFLVEAGWWKRTSSARSPKAGCRCRARPAGVAGAEHAHPGRGSRPSPTPTTTRYGGCGHAVGFPDVPEDLRPRSTTPTWMRPASRCTVALGVCHNFLPRPGDLMWTPADWAWIGGLDQRPVRVLVSRHSPGRPSCAKIRAAGGDADDGRLSASATCSCRRPR